MGRPRNLMTTRRQQVFNILAEKAAEGEPVRFAELARRCGLYDYRDARRIVRDLNRMGTA